MPRTRQNRPAKQKAVAQRRHLVDKVAVSDVCEELGMQPSVFYTWQKQLFENADKAFDGGRASNAREIELEAKIAALEAKLARKDAVIQFPLEGYRRLTFMMSDLDVAYVAPATTYRILKAAGRLDRWQRKPSLKGTGFVQPLQAHAHWHIDIAYLNVAGTFYYLCSVLDGYSRSIVHWEIREAMREAEVELILERARERYPDARPPQFIARDFKEYVRISGMTHVRISPGYPQSNGKIERWHRTLKQDTVRVRSPGSLEEARELVARFVEHYNSVRLHSALGYIAPNDMLAGNADRIHSERDRKLERARELRRQQRLAERELEQANQAA